MPDQTTLLIVVAITTLLLPVAFLVAVAYAAGRRRRGLEVGGRVSAVVTVLGGMSIGVFLITGADAFLVVVPILGAAALLVLALWRRRRRVQAGQLLVGTALPWTILFGFYLLGAVLEPALFDLRYVLLWLGAGVLGVVAGLVLIVRGDPGVPAPSAAAPVGDPGSRAFGNVAAAIREPGRIGPFGTSELAALVAYVAVWVLVPWVVPSGLPSVVAFLIPTVVGAVVAAEAYVRAMPPRSRMAFEAFSWLGEWELGQAKGLVGRIPTNRSGAERWLASHPDTPETRWIRIEVLELAGRFDEARAAAEQLPDSTPLEHWHRMQALDDIDWRAGGPGDLGALEATATGLLPADGDDRLRAEVSLAAAKVRRQMADGRSTPGDALEPLVEVRRRLGHRADGQVGRALRLRLTTLALAVGVVIGGAYWVFQAQGGVLF